jgi:hypothetical protein
MKRSDPRLRAALVASVVLTSGCELTEEVLAPAEDIVVAEALVQLREDLDGQRILVFLHRTVSGERSVAVPGARVVVTGPRGLEIVVPETTENECVAATPDIVPAGTCYYIEDDQGLGLEPGDRLELSIETATGEALVSATTIPAEHEIVTADGPWCWALPDTQVEVTWTASRDAWAYFAEALVNDLDDALQGEGIEVETDPFYLTGISVSASDTTIGFPGEFGVFDRADIATDLALRLQVGIPEGVVSDVAITAVDRNYTNWVRGGNFNPSGQVRIPSVRGEGTGYFGSTVVRTIQVLSIDLDQPSTECGSTAF